MWMKPKPSTLLWLFLIIAPLPLGGWFGHQLLTTACEAERAVTIAKAGGVDAAGRIPVLCRLTTDPGRVADLVSTSPKDAEVTSVDIASMRLSAMSAVSAVLLGIIATLLAYKAWLPVTGTSETLEGLSFDVRVDATSSDLRMVIGGAAGSAIRLANIVVTDPSGTKLLDVDGFTLTAGAVHGWSIFSAGTVWPPRVSVTGIVSTGPVPRWRFAAEVDLTSTPFVRSIIQERV